MSIETLPGTSSKLRIATRQDLLDSSLAADLADMVQRYVRAAHDMTVTPETAWAVMRDSVLKGDLDSLLILFVPEKVLGGFMYCQLLSDEKTAIINSAFIDSESRAGRDVVSEGLTMFEKWAKFNNAKKARFYTFRVPGAHRAMMKAGWKHVLTSYGKEL